MCVGVDRSRADLCVVAAARRLLAAGLSVGAGRGADCVELSICVVPFPRAEAEGPSNRLAC